MPRAWIVCLEDSKFHFDLKRELCRYAFEIWNVELWFFIVCSQSIDIDKLRKCLVNALIIIIKYWLESILHLRLNFHRWINQNGQINNNCQFFDSPFDLGLSFEFDRLRLTRQVSYELIQFDYYYYCHWCKFIFGAIKLKTKRGELFRIFFFAWYCIFVLIRSEVVFRETVGNKAKSFYVVES